MKRYLLDTALLAGFMHKRPNAVSLITPWLQQHAVVTSTIVYAEVIEYLKGLPDFPEHYAALHELLQEIIPYRLTYPILDRYADLRRQMRQPYGKGLIGDMDTLIAATALECHLTVVTTDRDYDRVPHLQWHLVDLKRAS